MGIKTLDEYSKAKGIDQSLLRELDIEIIEEWGEKALEIPYYDEAKNPVRTQLRFGITEEDTEKDSRFMWEKGDEEITFYGLWKLPKTAEKVFIVEGTSDCHNLWNAYGYEEFPVLGIPGKANYGSLDEGNWLSHIAEGFEEIVFVMEPDAEKEVKSGAEILSEKTRAKISVMDLPEEDVNALYLKDKNNFEHSWEKAVKNRHPFWELMELDWEPDIRRMEDVDAEDIDWLWKPYVPRRKITVLEGDPGVGKTFLALQISARLSQGEQFTNPGRNHGERNGENVIYMTAEDGLKDTLTPRLEEMGAKEENITFVQHKINTESQEKQFLTMQDKKQIRKLLAEENPGLLVIDPLQGFLGRDVDMHMANEVRPILAEMTDLAETYNTAVLLIRHFTKSSKGKTIYRGLGSIDIAAEARSILKAGEDPDNEDQMAMVHEKANLTQKGESLGYKINENGFEWTGESKLTARDLTSPEKTRAERTKKEQALEFIKAELEDGPKKSKEMFERAKNELDISKSTLKKAYSSDEIQTDTFKDGKSWYWRLKKLNGEKDEKAPF